MEKLTTLADHNEDIKQLIAKGFAVSIDTDYLVIRDIPYIDEKKDLCWGAIVSVIEFIDKVHVKLKDHQILFCGSHPCQLDGTYIANLGGGRTTLSLSSKDLVVERSFSNKPTEGFTNFYDKIESYVNIICGPAIHLHNANPLTFRSIEVNDSSMFNYADTLTSRAEIGDLSQNFNEDVIAIIGLGGTGAYILDFIAKTPVKEIRGYDLDFYHVHNAFRSPGKLENEELGMRKAEVYQNRYGSFRKNLHLHPKLILADSIDDLQGVTFAFVCVDKGLSRAGIIDLLMQMNIPFIDVGMGLSREETAISGILRTSYFPKDSSHDLLKKRSVPLSDLPDEIYRNNIQISELNALNACLAVIKYKQIRNFYVDDSAFHNILFTLDNISASGE